MTKPVAKRQTRRKRIEAKKTQIPKDVVKIAVVPEVIQHVAKERKFPHISRYIPERSLQFATPRSILVFMAIAISVIMVITVGVKYREYKAERTNFIEAKRHYEDAVAQKKYWQNLIGTYGDFRDGYFHLALLSYQLGEKDKAREYVKKTLEIDPTFEKGRELERML